MLVKLEEVTDESSQYVSHQLECHGQQQNKQEVVTNVNKDGRTHW